MTGGVALNTTVWPAEIKFMAERRLMYLPMLTAVVITVLTTVCSVVAAERPLPRTIDFNRDIRPIFSANCYFCHGPDKNKRKADLRLDTKDGLFSVREDRHTVIPDNPDDSELFRRITAADPDVRMPDPKSNKRLSYREIALIRKWIEQGAPWKGHWAYLKPARPEVPASDDSTFVKNPIDNFILAGLKDAGLQHGMDADRVTLIRRLSFDLAGLPPTPAEVESFVTDRSPDAYDKLVDRLLASPHFGERMAVWWLDLVRYADSIGYHSDNPMNVWPYRDYVIKAFNENKPFDRFTIEQLAGDLLPDATQEQKIASAYNRLLETTEEGGAQPKEYVVKYETDRVRDFSTVWMAGTMGCSQCHDHKFDPYTQKDFYSLAAFFGDIEEAATGRREQGMPVLDDEQRAGLKKLGDAIADAKKKLETDTPEIAAARDEWEKQQSQPIDWVVLNPSDWQVAGESKLRRQPDGSLEDYYKVAAKETYTIDARTDIKGITGFRLEALDDAEYPLHGPGTAYNGNFVLTAFKVTADGKPVKLVAATADHSQGGYPIGSAIDAAKGSGWAILPETGKPHEAVFETAEPIDSNDSTLLTFTLEFNSPFPQHNIGHLRLSVTMAGELAARSAPAEVKSALAIALDQRSDRQKNAIASYYRTISPLLRPVRDEVEKLEKSREELLKGAPACLVSASGPPREVRLLHRGNWQDETGEIESPAVPHFLSQPKGQTNRLTRLDLAKWVASPDNPLTARVVVNRLWKLFYGVGIAKNVDDLGSQGESPVNPELLDWLAVEFMESGWDVKHMVRLMVTSGTYRQSSRATQDDNEVDPFNRLCSHQSRLRLDAEMVRDNALAICGLLSPRMGGPSVKPYQPAGYWDPLNFPPRTYEASKGQDLYRRGVYTWWQRTFPHPSLLAFDAPSREEATCERLRSNIPQQALVLLNDPTYVEAARVFAARMMKEGGVGARDKINWAYQQALSRKARPQESQMLVDLYAKHLKEYTDDAESARKLLAVGSAPASKDLDASELAAWTSVARAIINLSETITRS